MDECPICLDNMSPTTTNVYMACCRQEIHLDCLRLCRFKCPYCRNEERELFDRHTSTQESDWIVEVPQPEQREVVMLYNIRYASCRLVVSLVLLTAAAVSTTTALLMGALTH